MVPKSPELFKGVLGKVVVEVLEERKREREERVRGVVMELEGFELGRRVGGLEAQKNEKSKVVEGSGEERVLIAA
jgi:hypothetical protein